MENSVSVGQIHEKLKESEGVLVDTIIKAGLPGKPTIKLEFWKTEYGEAILEIKGGKCRLFNLVDEDDI